MGRLDGNALPIIPLPRNKLFLPGSNQRIDVRSIGPLLSSIYERQPLERPGAPSGVQVVCVPISSSKSSHPPWNGEYLGSEAEADMSKIKAPDLFTFGVSARVVGIEEMEHGQGAVMKVQGIARCRIKSVSEDGPFLVATDYEHCPDQGIFILCLRSSKERELLC
jgi:ATP-dependent protease La (Lon)-like substrate-binding protein